MREENAGQNNFIQPKFCWVSSLPRTPSSLEISLEEKRKKEKISLKMQTRRQEKYIASTLNS